jgi:hypothetical protein
LDTASNKWNNNIKIDFIKYILFTLPCAVDLGPDKTIINGQSVTLTANGADGLTYLWNTNQTTKSITVTPSATNTTYSVTATLGACTASASIVITLSDCAVDLGPDKTIDKGTSTTLTATGKAGSTYQWSTNITNGGILVVTPTATTVYSVTMTNGSTCTATDQIVVTVNDPNGIRNITNPSNLKINSLYPNPATDNINLNITNNKTSQLKIIIRNVIGKEVLSINKGYVDAGNNSFIIDVSDLMKGIYLIELNTDNNKVYSKFTVQ